MWQKGDPGWRSGRGQGENALLQARQQVLGVNGDCAHEGLGPGPGLGRGQPTGSWGPAQGGPGGSRRFPPQEPWAHRGLPPLHTGPAQRPAPSLSTSPPTGSSSTRKKSSSSPSPPPPPPPPPPPSCWVPRAEPRAAWDIPISASLKLHWNHRRGGGASPPPAAGPNTLLKGEKRKMCTARKLALSDTKTCLTPP